jgi:hydroxymethylpyrimidine kinase/phosphomethylpyrimidine kinase/thiamine-phosphate diphosphorylase
MSEDRPNTPTPQYPNTPARPRAICWSIAGSDSGGGAGIQADLKTMNAFGVHGCTVITAITAQNTKGIAAIDVVSPGMIEAQLLALEKDLPPRAVKVGMLGTADVVNLVVRHLESLDAFVVCDPVLSATRGGVLLEPSAREILLERLLPRVDVLTPNVPEAEAFVGRKLGSTDAIESAAAKLVAMGARSVLIKGGHLSGKHCQDYWTDGRSATWLTSERQFVEHNHGGGCTLSSAIAAGIALGYPVLDALVLAKAYVNQGLRASGGIGSGRGPIAHGGWPSDPADLPWLTATADDAEDRLAFPDCGPEPLGLYPVVDSVSWLEKLLPLGVRTIQLRIKDPQTPGLEEEIRSGIALARKHDARLFINDHWELAIRHGGYGVHIGQDDLPTADLEAIHRSGLRLGISTHGYAELARALSVVPSYIAIGTVYPSPSKSFEHAAMGIEAFARLRKLAGVPVVAIGGITFERAPEVLAAGADGIAVISDITHAPDLAGRVASWKNLPWPN